jgi:hypothetical protein
MQCINVFEFFYEKIIDEIKQDFDEFKLTKKESLSYNNKEIHLNPAIRKEKREEPYY